MIEGLKPYAEYKNTGQDWLGELPAHWRLRRAKYLFREVDERSQTGKEELMSVSHITGVTPRSQKTVTMFLAESNVGYKVCRPDDVVINTLWAWMAALGVARQIGIVSPAYGVYRPLAADCFLPRYADLLLRTPAYAAEYLRRSTGVNSSRLRLYPEQFLCIPLVYPPSDEQATIVRFLEKMNRKIDRLIRTKRQLIKLLNEQKQVIIHRAVTRGLDPDVRLKPSGIEWLGDVPEDWEVKKLKYIKRHEPNSFVDGPFGSNLKSIHFVDNGDAYVVESGFITRGHFILKEFKTITREHFETIKRSECRGGDIIIAKIGAYFGMAGILPDLDKPAVVSGNALKLTINKQLCSNNFVHFALLTARALGALDWIVNATAQPAISLGAMNNLSIPLPNVDEQLRIIDFIQIHIEKFDSAINKANLEISLLREFRTRLISDIVTGKFDVRGVELPTIDEAEALEDKDTGEDTEAEELIESEEVADVDE